MTPQSGQVGRVAALDGIRGLAILVVVIHNAATIEHAGVGVLMRCVAVLTAMGWVGVQVFFVLSGFLITGLLIDARGTPNCFRRFYARRTLRIFPLYYTTLVVAFIVVPHIAAIPVWSATAASNQWWFWTYTSNWGGPLGHRVTGLGHLWSLAVEEQFYLMWPLVVFATSPRGLIRVCVAVILVAPIARLVLHLIGLSQFALYEFTIARGDALAAGALLATLLRDRDGARWLAARMPVMLTGAIVCSVALAGADHGFDGYDPRVQVAGQSFVAIAAAGLIYYCVTPLAGSGRLAAAMTVGWLRFLGKYSYGIYVLHYPIHIIVQSFASELVNAGSEAGRLLRLVAYIGVILGFSILAALASWRLIEEPCLRLRDRLAPRTGVAAS